jgi:hypothetical protein
MVALLWLLLMLLALPFKSMGRLEAENLALRHQLAMLRRKVPGRVQPTNRDRWFLIQLYRWFPSVLNAIKIVRPETLLCVGTVPASTGIGAGSPTPSAAGHQSMPNCGR